MTDPKVSVILPTHNRGDLVAESIQCVLNQTFDDFEFIIIDDGSKDDTASVVADFHDPRIRFFQQENKGLAATLNRAISLARAPLIARQDDDDISLPTRLEKQVAYFDQHPDCILLGTQAYIWQDDKPTDRAILHPTQDDIIRFMMQFDSCFVHPSVMMRKEAILAAGGYRTAWEHQPEDYDLFSRMLEHGKVANLDEKLIIYRELPGSITRTNNFEDRVCKIASSNMARNLGVELPTVEILDAVHLYRRRLDLLSGSQSFNSFARTLRLCAEAIGTSTGHTSLVSNFLPRFLNFMLQRYPKKLVHTLSIQERVHRFLMRRVRGLGRLQDLCKPS